MGYLERFRLAMVYESPRTLMLPGCPRRGEQSHSVLPHSPNASLRE